MKRTVLALALGLVGTLATTLSSHAQGQIFMDTYNTSGPLIGYNGSPITGSQWTVGLYWALGDVTGSVATDPSGFADPSTLGGGLQLGTGIGSTAPIVAPGYFVTTGIFQPPGGAAGALATIEIICYDGSDYLSSAIRGHSSAFTVKMGGSGVGGDVGEAWLASGAANAIAFEAVPVPEPTTMALAGLGAAALLAFRRRQQA